MVKRYLLDQHRAGLTVNQHLANLETQMAYQMECNQAMEQMLYFFENQLGLNMTSCPRMPLPPYLPHIEQLGSDENEEEDNDSHTLSSTTSSNERGVFCLKTFFYCNTSRTMLCLSLGVF